MSSLAEKEEADVYLLKKDDTVRMSVYQENELTTEAQLGKAGSVSFPLIGNVNLLGLSVKEAEETIRKLYEKDYLVSAQVNLAVVAYADKWVIIGGEINSPGTIAIPEEGALDLRGAIAQAGGLTNEASSSGILIRSKDGATKSLSLDASGGHVLKHGDSITVPVGRLERSTITVTGQVQKPGVLEYPKAGRLAIITAIAQAGDFSRIANTKEVVVRRAGKVIEVNLKNINSGKSPMFFMQPGDLLIVKESIW